MIRILINHTGYSCGAPKRFAVQWLPDTVQGQTSDPRELSTFQVVRSADASVMHEGTLDYHGAVSGWNCGSFWTGDFSELKASGFFRIAIQKNSHECLSYPFQISTHNLLESTVSDLLFYFKGQRITGPYSDLARRATYYGDDESMTVDVHGGWHDASADFSAVMSHLHFANLMNPQQQPLTVWALAEGSQLLENLTFEGTANLIRRCREEAAWGADFLKRMQHSPGYFYNAVMNRQAPGKMKTYDLPEGREICTHDYSTKQRGKDYQIGFRQGGGVCIAALARCAALKIAGDFPCEEYLAAARLGYSHLKMHNHEYLNDGRPNIIDDYGALLSALEIYGATNDEEYLIEIERWTTNLCERQCTGHGYDGWFVAGDDVNRPFHHPSDEGLAVIALVGSHAALGERHPLACRTRETISRAVSFWLNISTKDVTNPFNYIRQLVKATDESTPRAAFFMPHQNETGYWWQGENGRIASIAYALLKARPYLEKNAAEQALVMAQSQIDWILGLNPVDSCLMQGRGWNNRNYLSFAPNAPGGVSNGITAKHGDESDIEFMPSRCSPGECWRWAEQWLPHASWLLLATMALDEACRTE